MKHLKIYLAIILLAFGINAEAQRKTPPAAGVPLNFTLPKKNTKVLDNGLKTTYIQYGIVPKVTVSLIIKTGNVHETENQIWLADLTADMMREGTTTMNFTTISKKVAGMGGEININVGLDETTITASVLSEYASDLIVIMGDLLMNPAFSNSEIERLKNNLKRQLSYQMVNPHSQAAEKLYSTIYPNHVYGRIIPSNKMIDLYTLEMVKEFYKQNFGAKRSSLYVVGKFNESHVSVAVKKSFGTWKPGPEVDYPKAIAKHTNEIAIIDRKDSPQTTIMVGSPSLTPKDPDYIALVVTNYLLGNSSASRITTNIREDKGYTYSPASIIEDRQGTSIWIEEANVTTKFTGASLIEISKEITKLQKERPSNEELEGIKNYAAGLFVIQNSSPEGIIEQLNYIDMYNLNENYLTDYIKNIYAVTPKKVSQITKDYLNYPDMTMVLVGDKEKIKKQNKEIIESRKIN
tara:strand:- start:583 stop:1971 length:1389 start_codon:yes stop_codon:yes gene_type:complete